MVAFSAAIALTASARECYSMTDQSVIMRQAINEGKKLSILDSARRLLVKRGFQDITLDEVARLAGVAKGTLFLYYRNKDELFAAAFADLVDRLALVLDELSRSDQQGEALLRATVRAILAHLEQNRDFVSQFGAGKFPACGSRSSGLLMKKFLKNNRRLSRLLARALGRRGPGPSDQAFEAFALFGLCRSAMMEKLILKSDRPLVDRADKVVEFFLAGVVGKR